MSQGRGDKRKGRKGTPSKKSRTNKNRLARSGERSTGRFTPRPQPLLLPPTLAVPALGWSDQNVHSINEHDLGLVPATESHLRNIARILPTEPTLLGLARLLQIVERTRPYPKSQVEIAQHFYGDGDIARRITNYVPSTERWQVFDPLAITGLLSIVLQESQDERTNWLEDQDGSLFRSLVLGATSVLNELVTRRASEAPNADAFLALSFQSMGTETRLRLANEIGRAEELFMLATTDPDFVSYRERCPIDTWFADLYDLSFEEQSKIGLAFASLSRAWSGDAVSPIPVEEVAGVLTAFGLDTRYEAAMAIFSSTAREFREVLPLSRSTYETMFDIRPFKRTPFLRTADGRLILLSDTFMTSWLGEGFHYRQLAAAQALDEKNSELGSSGGNGRAYLELNGKLTERYCLKVAEFALEVPTCRSRYQLFPEQSYGREGGKKTSDILILEGQDLVLVEVHARRISAELVSSGDSDTASRELFVLIAKKIDQLGVSISALLQKHAQIPDVSIDEVQRIWPIIVTSATLFQSPLLWAKLREQMDPMKVESLKASKVRPITLLDVGEYEQLWGYVEEGHSLSRLLKKKTGASDLSGV